MHNEFYLSIKKIEVISKEMDRTQAHKDTHCMFAFLYK